MNTLRLYAFAALSALGTCFVPGCQHDVSTPFPVGLEPLEADPASPPAASGGSSYPETVSVQQGSDATSDYVHATGYVDASLESVWAAFKDPNVVVDRHAVSSFTVTSNVETGYDVSFRTSYTVNGVVTVSFDLTWREGVVEGTEQQPSAVSVVYEKTFGSSFVSMMKGSIELVSVTPTVTELQFAQRMNATNTDSGTIATWTQELFASVVARVHGKPLP